MIDITLPPDQTEGTTNVVGKWFKAVPYNVKRDDQRIDYEEVEQLAHQHKPKVIIAGGSAYPRFLPFQLTTSAFSPSPPDARSAPSETSVCSSPR